MSSNNLVSNWINSYCAPVVLTCASPGAEKICMQNGLLLHELLSCFGHLSGLNSIIRMTNGSSISVSDAQIRFERVTEVRPKPSENVEQVLYDNFSPYPLPRIPTNLNELRASPPSAWTPKMEQILSHSVSFSEYETLSYPIIFLTAVATTDPDPLAAVKELVSVHHVPSCYTNGQYDPIIHRVYLILEDLGEKEEAKASNKFYPDSAAVYKSISTQYGYGTKLISINSLLKSSPNLQQPDMWSQYLIPKFFPSDAPSLDDSCYYHSESLSSTTSSSLSDEGSSGERKQLSLLTPSTSSNTTSIFLPKRNVLKPVYGSRLNGDDFMRLFEYTKWLYCEQIIPSMEKKLATLQRIVNDSRKGVKNVLKSFWRKPREDPTPPSSSSSIFSPSASSVLSSFTSTSPVEREKTVVKYRYDKIESQTLHLADLSFIIGDYETALTNYRFVKEDFKADKSYIHLAHVLLMSALCYLKMDSYKYMKDILGCLEGIHHCILSAASPFSTSLSSPSSTSYSSLSSTSVPSSSFAASADVLHILAFFALISAEIYTHPLFNIRSPQEAARILTSTNQYLGKFSLTSSLFTEKISLCYLVMNQVRKFVFYQVLAGNKYHKAGDALRKIEERRRREILLRENDSEGNIIKDNQNIDKLDDEDDDEDEEKKFFSLLSLHGLINYINSLVVLEKSSWGDLRSKLYLWIAQDLMSLARLNLNLDGERLLENNIKNYLLMNNNDSTSTDSTIPPTSSATPVNSVNSLSSDTHPLDGALDEDAKKKKIEKKKEKKPNELKFRSILFMFKVLITILDDKNNVGVRASLTEALSVFSTLSSGISCSDFLIMNGWEDFSGIDLLLNKLPVQLLEENKDANGDLDDYEIDEEDEDEFNRRKNKSSILVTGLPLPEVELASVNLVENFNGINNSNLSERELNELNLDRQLLSDLLLLEINFEKIKNIKNDLKITSFSSAAASSSTFSMLHPDSNQASSANFLDEDEIFTEQWVSLLEEHEAKKQALASGMISSTSPSSLYSPASSYILTTTTIVKNETKNQLVSFSSSSSASASSSVSSSYSSSSSTTTIKIPQNEPINLRVRLSNSSPFNLSLTNFYPVFDNNNKDFKVKKRKEKLNSGDKNDYLLTFSSSSLGNYNINSLNWNLSPSLKVNFPIQKPGKLLPKSISKARAVDTSLLFSIIPSSSLLEISLDSLPTECLQGEILHTKLRIFNKGDEIAKNIYIKFSDPIFLLKDTKKNNENDQKILNFYGNSCTVVKLSKDYIIKPKEELEFDIYLKISLLGLKKFNILVNYSSSNNKAEDDDEDILKDFYETNEDSLKKDDKTIKRTEFQGEKLLSITKNSIQFIRNSIFSFTIRSLPSLGSSIKLISKHSSPNTCTFISEINNYIRDFQEKDLLLLSSPPLASSGSSSLENDEEYKSIISKIHSNCFKISSISLTGSVRLSPLAPPPLSSPSSPFSTEELKLSSLLPNLLAAPDERLVQCFPVELTASTSSSSPLSLITSSPEELSLLFKYLLTDPANLAMLFLSLNNSSFSFQNELNQAFERIQLKKLDEETGAPRSIAAVRRERQMKLQLEEEEKRRNEENYERSNEINEDIDDDEEGLVQIDLDDIPSSVSTSVKHRKNQQQKKILLKPLEPVHALVFWLSSYKNTLRFGLTTSLNLLNNLIGQEKRISRYAATNNKYMNYLAKKISSSSSVSSTPSSSTAPASSSLTSSTFRLPTPPPFESPISRLFIGLEHEKSINLIKNPSNFYSSQVKLTLKLRNYSKNNSILLYIAGLNYEEDPYDKFVQDSFSLPMFIPDKIAQMNRKSCLPFEFDGKKTRDGIILKKNEEILLYFYLNFYTPGVYNLNRFLIRGRYLNEEEEIILASSSSSSLPTTPQPPSSKSSSSSSFPFTSAASSSSLLSSYSSSISLTQREPLFNVHSEPFYTQHWAGLSLITIESNEEEEED